MGVTYFGVQLKRNMASFSDDEIFEVDSILEQRKRKGILHYLVQWKEGDSTWEPAEKIGADCATAVAAFEKQFKRKTRRSSSKSRKSSRSRSRSQSRSRKGSSKAVRKSSRSRSRGRQTEAATKQTTTTEEPTLQVQTRRSLGKREPKVEVEVKAAETKPTPAASVSASSSSTSVKSSTSVESNSTEKMESQSGRTLRSSTMEARKNLEVQRVHNEQRPVREDDNKPRSAIWKIADYAVIALFIISLIAAIFMFLEKFMDLENFKKQAFPSFETLSVRLQAAKDHLVEFFLYGWDRTSDGWTYILEQVKQPAKAQPVPP